MSLSSLEFIFIFLPLGLLAYLFTPAKFRNLSFFILSLIFYSWAEPVYLGLLLALVGLGYGFGLLLEGCEDGLDKRFYFVLALSLGLLPLVFYKYYGFFIEIINKIFRSNLKIRQLALPLGISFYSFKLVSYLTDIYRGDIRAEKNFVNLGAYLAAFPQIGAGPITRYQDFGIESKNRKITSMGLGRGMERFILGLAKKVILADNLALIWQQVKDVPHFKLSFLMAWLGILAYALQLYLDFSGYSDMALGLGQMMGFSWPENFNYPYMAKSIKDFWSRWHISLGSWFRDYIYIPLGGSRVDGLKEFRNLFVVWLLTGLWHGASLSFILWGLYFGALLLLERKLGRKYLKDLPDWLKQLGTFILVLIGWVFFDLDSMMDILLYLSRMFGYRTTGFMGRDFIYLFKSNFVLLILGLLAMTPLVGRKLEKLRKMGDLRVNIGLYVFYFILFILSTAMLLSSSYTSFLYVNF